MSAGVVIAGNGGTVRAGAPWISGRSDSVTNGDGTAGVSGRAASEAWRTSGADGTNRPGAVGAVGTAGTARLVAVSVGTSVGTARAGVGMVGELGIDSDGGPVSAGVGRGDIEASGSPGAWSGAARGAALTVSTVCGTARPAGLAISGATGAGKVGASIAGAIGEENVIGDVAGIVGRAASGAWSAIAGDGGAVTNGAGIAVALGKDISGGTSPTWTDGIANAWTDGDGGEAGASRLGAMLGDGTAGDNSSGGTAIGGADGEDGSGDPRGTLGTVGTARPGAVGAVGTAGTARLGAVSVGTSVGTARLGVGMAGGLDTDSDGGAARVGAGKGDVEASGGP